MLTPLRSALKGLAEQDTQARAHLFSAVATREALFAQPFGGYPARFAPLGAPSALGARQ